MLMARPIGVEQAQRLAIAAGSQFEVPPAADVVLLPPAGSLLRLDVLDLSGNVLSDQLIPIRKKDALELLLGVSGANSDSEQCLSGTAPH